MAKKKITQEQFIARSKEVHGDTYDYSESHYIGSEAKITVKCKVHGEFYQTPYNHWKGHGCKICSSTTGANGRVVGTDEFIRRARAKFGEKFDYSLVNYVNNSTNVTIVCPVHGNYAQKPVNHLASPSGCPFCYTEGKMCDTASFIDICSKVHNNIYDYSLVQYRNNSTKVAIVCRSHGIFYQTPANHSQGQKCPCCNKTGLKFNLPTFLYVIVSNELTKVGISNNKSRSRLKEINANSRRVFREITRFNLSNGHIAAQLEKETLSWLAANYKNTSIKFSGMTECFEDVDNTALLNKIVNIIKEYQKCN